MPKNIYVKLEFRDYKDISFFTSLRALNVFRVYKNLLIYDYFIS